MLGSYTNHIFLFMLSKKIVLYIFLEKKKMLQQ